MKQNWIRKLSLSMVLSLGFLFLGTTAVSAEEEPIEARQEVSDQKEEQSPEAAVSEVFEPFFTELNREPSEPGAQDWKANLPEPPIPPQPPQRVSIREAQPVYETYQIETAPEPSGEAVLPETYEIHTTENTPEADNALLVPVPAESILPEPYESTPAEAEDSKDTPGTADPTINASSEPRLNEIEAEPEEEILNTSIQEVRITEGEPSELIAVSKEMNPAGTSELTQFSEAMKPAEFVISGTDIPLENGEYSFRLVIRTDRTLTFDNDLQNTYQGIDGSYRLHYDINPDESHRMITDGAFAGIITASPLLAQLPERIQDWVETHITDDSYLYHLDLLTGQGFTFENALGFLVGDRKLGYNLKYTYDLPSDTSSLYINGIPISLKPCRKTSRSSLRRIGLNR